MKYFIGMLLSLLICSPAMAAPDLHDMVSGTYERHSVTGTSYSKASLTKRAPYKKGHVNVSRDQETGYSSGRVAHGWGPYAGSIGPRPGRWCGYFMRSIFGGGAEYNLAANWAKRGTNAGGPREGAVVVWPHHVALITGRAKDGRWMVLNGNYRNRVAEVPMTLRGAIAYRMM